MFPSRTSLLTSFAYTSLPGRMRLFIFTALNWHGEVSHVQLRGTGTDTVWVESLSSYLLEYGIPTPTAPAPSPKNRANTLSTAAPKMDSG